VLPPSMFGPGPLKWIYLALAVLMMSAMVDMYVPLFGQRLAHLVPVVAGFLGAALAIGWAVSELVSASLKRATTINRVVVAAPLVIAVGLSLAAVTQVEDASTGFVVTWAVALTLTGVGLGSGWPHLSAWAMQCVDEQEGAAAGAAINTIEMIAGAFGAGLAGVVVNSAEGSVVVAARALFAVFAVVGVLGALAARHAVRGLPQ
jgi:MFS family permease